MKKIAIFLMFISILSQISGFLRELTLSYFYGASNISDAYLISLTIPMVIFAFVGKALSTSFIPIYASVEKEKGNRHALLFTRNLINHLILIMVVIVAISFIFAPQIVKLFASGFDNYTSNIATSFSRITIFGIFFMMIVNIFSSLLQFHNKFVLPALTGVVMNLIVIISFYLSWKFNNLIILSVGTLGSMIAQTMLLYPAMKKMGFKSNFKIQIKDENIQQMLYLSIPVIAGVSVNEINVLVDRTIASGISVGGISALNYANKLNGFIYGIFVFSIATVFFPTIIKKINQGDHKGFIRSFNESLLGVTVLVMPATFGLVVLTEPIVSLLYGRGAFDEEAVALTSSALFYYSIGILGVSLRIIISKVYYAIKDTKTPMINASIGLILNIVLNLILSRYLGIGGLALATSISAIVTMLLLLFGLRKKLGPLGMRAFSIDFIKILASSLVMAMIAKLTYHYFNKFVSDNLSLIMAILIGALTYLVSIYFMKLRGMSGFTKLLKRRF